MVHLANNAPLGRLCLLYYREYKTSAKKKEKFQFKEKQGYENKNKNKIYFQIGLVMINILHSIFRYYKSHH